MLVSLPNKTAEIPPRPKPSPNLESIKWAYDRFSQADEIWTGILPSVIGNHTPRWDAKISEAMRRGFEQAKAGNEVLEEMTGLKTPDTPFVAKGEKYTQAQFDLSRAMYDSRYVVHQSTTEAMQAILAVRKVANGLFNIINDNGSGHYNAASVFPVLTKS